MYLGVAPTTAPTGIATVAFVNGDDVFNSCQETLTVVVTALAVGTTAVTFAIDDTKSSGDPHLGWSLAEAAFTVTVTEDDGGGGSGTTCDEDPAAPAWAAALLKANGFKAKGKAATADNYVSQVAGAMTNGADFGGFAKNAHPEYEDAVWAYMTGTLGLSLPVGPDGAARPGWVCTSV